MSHDEAAAVPGGARPSQGRLLAGLDRLAAGSPAATLDERRRTRLLVGTALLTSAAAAVTALDVVVGNHVQPASLPDAATVLGVAAAAMACTPVLIRAGVRTNRVATYVLSILFITVSYLTLAYGGVSAPSALWMPILPLVALTLSGPIAASVVAAIAILGMAATYVMAAQWRLLTYEMAPSEHAWWTLWTLVQITAFLWGFAVLSERDRARSQAQVVAANAQLVEEMAAREKAENALRLRYRAEAVAQLTAGLAHEINTPLQIAADNVLFLEESATRLLRVTEDAGRLRPCDERLNAAIAEADVPFAAREVPIASRRVNDALARITRIVSVMRELTEGGDAPFELVDLNPIVLAAASVVDGQHGEVVSLNVETGKLPLARCRVREIHEALLAVLANAVQAIQVAARAEKGTIAVRTTSDGDRITVTVTDDGCGIPRQLRDRVFDPFFTTRPVGTALGQGLTVARAIVVDRHHGSLVFDSKEGIGTTFSIVLPASRP